MWLNAFPSKNSSSINFSPRVILTNTALDWKHHCQVPFGSYCQVYTDTTPHNSPTPRTVDAICLGPTGNLQGSYKFFSLDTMQKIVCHQFVSLPMPKSIIQRVNIIALRENQPRLHDIRFTVRDGKIVNVNDSSHMAGVDHNENHYDNSDVNEPNQPFYNIVDTRDDYRSDAADHQDTDHRSDGTDYRSDQSVFLTVLIEVWSPVFPLTVAIRLALGKNLSTLRYQVMMNFAQLPHLTHLPLILRTNRLILQSILMKDPPSQPRVRLFIQIWSYVPG